MTPIEKAITGRLISGLLEAGLRLGVNDGEDTTLRYSDDREAVFSALGSTAWDYLLVYEVVAQGGGTSFALRGWVQLIWGNGIDLISDSTTGSVLDPHVDAVVAWCNTVAQTSGGFNGLDIRTEAGGTILARLHQATLLETGISRRAQCRDRRGGRAAERDLPRHEATQAR